MKKMLFVYNPMAGKEQISTHLSNIDVYKRQVYRYNMVESTKERRWSNMERIVWIKIRKKVPTPQRASP